MQYNVSYGYGTRGNGWRQATRYEVRTRMSQHDPSVELSLHAENHATVLRHDRKCIVRDQSILFMLKS